MPFHTARVYPRRAPQGARDIVRRRTGSCPFGPLGEPDWTSFVRPSRYSIVGRRFSVYKTAYTIRLVADCSTAGNRERRLMAQAVEVGANDSVALTGCRFQPFAVLDRHAPVHVADETGLLECAGDDTDGRTLNSQH